MIQCLECGALWRGEPTYCGRCGVSLGGKRYCSRNHQNPADAEFCLTCGRSELTTPGRSRHFGLLTQLIAVAALIALARLTLAVAPYIIWPLLKCLNWLSGYVFGTPISSLLGCLCPIALPFVLWSLMTERGALPSRSLKTFTSILWVLGRVGWKVTTRLALPPAAPPVEPVKEEVDETPVSGDSRS